MREEEKTNVIKKEQEEKSNSSPTKEVEKDLPCKEKEISIKEERENKEDTEIINETSKKEEEIKIENKTTIKKSHKTFFILSISFIVICLLFLLFSTVFALINHSKSTIIGGVRIKDIDVSGLTKEQALEKVTTIFNEKIEQIITLTHNEYQIEVFPRAI